MEVNVRWSTGRRSGNVIDARGGGGMGLPIAGGGIGMVVLALVVYLLGGDPSAVIDTAPAPAPAEARGSGGPPDEASEFVRVVLADTEDTWNAIFAQNGQDYPEPQLVLFTGAVQSGCGVGQSQMGPFYCPRDQRVYIDLQFYQELRDRFGAPGDFAQAYVIAHEVGHHVQTVLGVSDQVRAAQQRGGQRDANALSVRMELQADCFAGVWANHAQRVRNVVEPGDIEEALNAASAIGDDKIQRQSQGRVAPESFTHGSSAQRMEWFRRGYETGDAERCDTFRS
jgi:predicted metalloprotease